MFRRNRNTGLEYQAIGSSNMQIFQLVKCVYFILSKDRLNLTLCDIVMGVDYSAEFIFSHVIYNSTAKSRRNTKIDTKVVHATADISHQFQGQKVKGQGHQENQPYRRNGKTCRPLLAGGRGKLWRRPHYRPHRLLIHGPVLFFYCFSF